MENGLSQRVINLRHMGLIVMVVSQRVIVTRGYCRCLRDLQKKYSVSEEGVIGIQKWTYGVNCNCTNVSVTSERGVSSTSGQGVIPWIRYLSSGHNSGQGVMEDSGH